MIDLDDKYLQDVKAILKEHVPDCEVRAYGSRVRDKARKYSDLDLAIVGTEKIDRRKIIAIKEAFAESNLPIMVDVLDVLNISDEFRNVIEKEYEVVQKPSRQPEKHSTKSEN